MYEQEIAKYRTQKSFTVEDLRTILKILRCENGCPWDREQTHKTITKDLLEEAYEVVEAIEAESGEMLCEEIGDLLLQVVFHTTIGEEEKDFSFDDAVNGICIKMVERHPHVFGDVVAETSEKVLTNWEKIKAETKKQETLHDRLTAVPVTFPALMRAQKLIHRTEKWGESVPQGEFDFTAAEDRERAVAEALWQLAAAADKAGVDAESALRHYSDSFIQKYKN